MFCCCVTIAAVRADERADAVGSPASIDERLAAAYKRGQQDAHAEFLTPAALAATGPEDPRYAKGQRDAREQWEADGPWFKSVVHQCCEDKETAYATGRAEALTEARDVVIAYANERLVHTEHPNMSEDITAALRTAAGRIKALRVIE